jgi:hypothetical protein
MVELPDPGFKRWQVIYHGAEKNRTIEEHRSAEGSEFRGQVILLLTNPAGQKAGRPLQFDIPATDIEGAWKAFDGCARVAVEEFKTKMRTQIVVPQGMPAGRGN